VTDFDDEVLQLLMNLTGGDLWECASGVLIPEGLSLCVYVYRAL
jgi:hypothetical protein